MRIVLYTLAALVCLPLAARSMQADNGIDPEVLIERILAVDSVQRSLVNDIVFDAEYVEREDKGDKGIKEKVRLVKKIYVRFDEDTALYHEEFLEYYKDGELKSEKDLRKEAKKRREQKVKRKGKDMTYPILRPFHDEYRDRYDITYVGLEDEMEGCDPCHHFRVHALEEVDSLVNGDFYFESSTFHLVRVDFSPAKLVKKTMFRLKELKLSMLCDEVADDIWLPVQFDVRGKGKAALFFGVNFAGTEYYRNPVINSGLDDSLFVGEDDD